MSSTFNLASAIVNDLVEVGLAVKIDDFTLESIDGEVRIEIIKKDNAIYIYDNGVLSLEVSTLEENFNEVIIEYLAGSLNF